MAYATTAALASEATARKAADASEAAARATADTQEATARAVAHAALSARLSALESWRSSITESRKVVPVSGIPALLAAIADDTVDAIVIEDGTYAVHAASASDPQSLWIGHAYAGRTRPLSIDPRTPGGVVLDGGGAVGWEGVVLQEVHDLSWGPMRLANATVVQGGAVVLGQSGSFVPLGVRNVALRGWTVEETVKSGSPLAQLGDHAVYVSSSSTPGTGISLDGWTVLSPGPDGLDSALHVYVQPALGVGPQGLSVTGWRVVGTDQALVFWDPSSSAVVSVTTVTGARRFAVRYEGGQVSLVDVASTGSGVRGLFTDLASTPGLTLSGCSLD